MTALLSELLRSWRGALRRPDFLALAGATLALGLAATLTAGRLLERFLYGVDAADPPALLALLATLLLAGLAATALPALRAARVAPMRALRVD
jgi:ABC-type antimicrobial peptide transport system permease subunit